MQSNWIEFSWTEQNCRLDIHTAVLSPCVNEYCMNRCHLLNQICVINFYVGAVKTDILIRICYQPTAEPESRYTSPDTLGRSEHFELSYIICPPLHFFTNTVILLVHWRLISVWTDNLSSMCVFCCTLMEFSSLACRTAVQHATSDPAYRYVTVCRAATSCSLQLHHLLPCTANVHVNTLTSSSSPPRFFLFSEPSLHVFSVAWLVHSSACVRGASGGFPFHFTCVVWSRWHFNTETKISINWTCTQNKIMFRIFFFVFLAPREMRSNELIALLSHLSGPRTTDALRER